MTRHYCRILMEDRVSMHHRLTAAAFHFFLIMVLFTLGAILRIIVITITILDSAQTLVNPPLLMARTYARSK